LEEGHVKSLYQFTTFPENCFYTTDVEATQCVKTEAESVHTSSLTINQECRQQGDTHFCNVMVLRATLIDHINLDVRNFEETQKFYSEVFGFILLADQPNRRCRIIGNDNIKLCMYEIPTMEIGPGINHIGFHVANFDDIERKCRELNIHILYDGIKVWEKSRSFYIEDPNGYEIELSEVAGGGL
jgi:lactoylglutathione lyase